MMRLIYLLSIFFLASAQEIQPPYFNGTDGYIISCLNDLVDEAIPYVSELIRKLQLDPARIPDVSWNFSVKGIFNTYKGGVGLNDGRLYDLSTIRRNGNVTIYYKDKHLRLQIGIGFNELSIYSKYGIRIAFFEHAGMVNGKVKSVNANIILDFRMDEYDLSVWRFKISNDIKFRVQLYGNRLLDWIATPITNMFLRAFSEDVISTLEKRVTRVVQTKLDLISSHFPGVTTGLLEQYVDDDDMNCNVRKCQNNLH